jgi:hypothetical protein
MHHPRLHDCERSSVDGIYRFQTQSSHSLQRPQETEAADAYLIMTALFRSNGVRYIAGTIDCYDGLDANDAPLNRRGWAFSGG